MNNSVCQNLSQVLRNRPVALLIFVTSGQFLTCWCFLLSSLSSDKHAVCVQEDMFHLLSSDNSIYCVQQRPAAEVLLHEILAVFFLLTGVTQGSQRLLLAFLLFNLSLRDDLSLPRTPINILVCSSQRH